MCYSASQRKWLQKSKFDSYYKSKYLHVFDMLKEQATKIFGWMLLDFLDHEVSLDQFGIEFFQISSIDILLVLLEEQESYDIFFYNDFLSSCSFSRCRLLSSSSVALRRHNVHALGSSQFSSGSKYSLRRRFTC